MTGETQTSAMRGIESAAWNEKCRRQKMCATWWQFCKNKHVPEFISCGRTKRKMAETTKAPFTDAPPILFFPIFLLDLPVSKWASPWPMVIGSVSPVPGQALWMEIPWPFQLVRDRVGLKALPVWSVPPSRPVPPLPHALSLLGVCQNRLAGSSPTTNLTRLWKICRLWQH